MSYKESFNAEKQTLKELKFHKKIEYIFNYHKLELIILLVLFLFVFTYLVPTVKKSRVKLSVEFVNCYDTDANVKLQDLLKSFTEKSKMLEEKEIYFGNSLFFTVDSDYIFFNDNAATMQNIMVKSSAGKTDAVIGDSNTMLYFSCTDMFCDLRDVFSEEQLKQYEDKIIYVDKKMIDMISTTKDDPIEIFLQFGVGKNKDEMKEPIPVLIDLSENSTLKGMYKTEIYFGMTTDKHSENVIEIVDFLFIK